MLVRRPGRRSRAPGRSQLPRSRNAPLGEHTDTPQLVGRGAFFTLNAFASFLTMSPFAGDVQYSTSPPTVRRTSARVPGLGGKRLSVPSRASTTAFIWKSPSKSPFKSATCTGPFIPVRSLYLARRPAWERVHDGP